MIYKTATLRSEGDDHRARKKLGEMKEDIYNWMMDTENYDIEKYEISDNIFRDFLDEKYRHDLYSLVEDLFMYIEEHWDDLREDGGRKFVLDIKDGKLVFKILRLQEAEDKGVIIEVTKKY
jgi:hypothetical protein